LKKSCPCATLSTINPTWTGLGLNLGLCGERLTTNCLHHGMVPLYAIQREKNLIKTSLRLATAVLRGKSHLELKPKAVQLASYFHLNSILMLSERQKRKQ
jgi:hypothetical protein